jgi:hypothetical protein
MTDITRFKVYNPKGVVIWSDDKRLVGQSFSENAKLQEALEGKVVADMTSLEKAENLFDRTPSGRAIEKGAFTDAKANKIGLFEAADGAHCFSMKSARWISMCRRNYSKLSKNDQCAG